MSAVIGIKKIVPYASFRGNKKEKERNLLRENGGFKIREIQKEYMQDHLPSHFDRYS